MQDERRRGTSDRRRTRAPPDPRSTRPVGSSRTSVRPPVPGLTGPQDAEGLLHDGLGGGLCMRGGACVRARNVYGGMSKVACRWWHANGEEAPVEVCPWMRTDACNSVRSALIHLSLTMSSNGPHRVCAFPACRLRYAQHGLMSSTGLPPTRLPASLCPYPTQHPWATASPRPAALAFPTLPPKHTEPSKLPHIRPRRGFCLSRPRACPVLLCAPPSPGGDIYRRRRSPCCSTTFRPTSLQPTPPPVLRSFSLVLV